MSNQETFVKLFRQLKYIYSGLFLHDNFDMTQNEDLNKLIEENLIYFLNENLTETLTKLSNNNLSQEEFQSIIDFVNKIIAFQIVIEEIQNIVMFNDNSKYMFGEKVFELIQKIDYKKDDKKREITTSNPIRDKNIQEALHIISRSNHKL